MVFPMGSAGDPLRARRLFSFFFFFCFLFSFSLSLFPFFGSPFLLSSNLPPLHHHHSTTTNNNNTNKHTTTTTTTKKQIVPTTPLKVTTTGGKIVITPPKKNFTAIDPTTNATAFPVPTWARLTAKENTVAKQGQAVLNATGYPFVYGYVPATGLKNTTNYPLAAVGVAGTAVNATATALNFTSPVAGLGNDLAQAINNAIKVCGFFSLSFCFVGKSKKKRRKKERKRRRRRTHPSTNSPRHHSEIEKSLNK